MLTVGVLYVRALAALVLPLTADVVVPVLLLQGSEGRFDVGLVRFVGVLPVALGGWLLVDSVFLRFAHEGKGTLAPIDPPKFLVRGGAYRLVRNPMYVANVAILLGEGLIFESWRVLAWALVVLLAFHLFVVGYEEPTLRRKFGESYEEYRRQVGRWLPRRR